MCLVRVARLIAEVYERAAGDIFPDFYAEVRRIFEKYYPKDALELLAKAIVKKAAIEVSVELSEGRLPDLPHDYLLNRCNRYLKMMDLQRYRIFIDDDVKRRVKENIVFLIIGAGFSVAGGAPLRSHLDSLLKNVEVKDYDELVRSQKQGEFKKRFANSIKMNPEIFKNTLAHRVVAEAFINKKIIEIVSLNWDSLIENEREEIRYRKINQDGQTPKDDDGDGFFHYLWKLNGDVEDLEYEWVFPNMEERIFQSFAEYVKTLKNNVLLMLIIGYSECDEKGLVGNTKLCREVISPLSAVQKTYRIGMDLGLLDKYDDYVVAPAEIFLPLVFS
jgi:hypothetical protein